MNVLAEAAVPIRLHELLVGFQSDAPSLGADALLVLGGAAYLIARRRLARKGRRWPLAVTALFFCGLAVLFVAIGSGLAAYDDDNFPAHVVQHILLMMVAPPLLVLGRPVTLFLQAGGRELKSAGARLVSSRAFSYATGTAAMIVYYGFMWVYFLTPLYAESIRIQPLHDAVHVVCVLLGLAYWQFVLGPDRFAGRPSHQKRVLAILAGMPAEMYLGFVLHASTRPIGPGTTAASVRAGGEVFWWLSMLLSGIAFALALRQWMVESERAARRLDAAAARGGERLDLEPPAPVGYESPLSGQGEISLG